MAVKIWEFELDEEVNELTDLPHTLQVFVVDIAELILFNKSCEDVESQVWFLSVVEETLHEEVHSLHISNRCMELAVVKQAISQIVLLHLIHKLRCSKNILDDLLPLNLQLLVNTV